MCKENISQEFRLKNIELTRNISHTEMNLWVISRKRFVQI